MESAVTGKALLHAVLEAAVDAIILSDRHGIIMRANPAAGAMFGHATDDMIGKNVSMLMPEALAIKHDGFIQHHIETGEKRIIGIGREVEGLHSDGTVFPLHLSVGRAEVDGRLMFVGILHDLTKRAQTEAALARSQRLDAIGRMTGGIAHDFNNLLTVIMGNLELLDARAPDDAQDALIRDALEAAELGADLTSRLMIFARRSNLKPVKSDLRKLCDSTLVILKRTLGAQIGIRTEYAPDISLVLVDPVQLQSALMNLALNARDSMDGKGELLISIADVTIDDTYMAQEIDVEPGHYVRLSVSDNGAGMTPEAQKHAFEPFFTTKSDSGGNGLGLSMVYGFVRQTGGHITLYSEEGLGTSFGLYFPSLSEKSASAERSHTGRYAAQAPFGKGRKVLVVEDNPNVRRLSVTRLRDLGFEVAEAVNGDEALALLRSGIQIDIVFSDLIMPGSLSGYELAAQVAVEFPHLKVLLTSGYASDIVAARGAVGENHDVLHKPYRQSDLVARLQALLVDDPEG
ncbi:PAS domain S-box protein [Pontivivens nitratireducens]|uniref:PAS domain S-box protein n=1 Tax=Pontivivens nitratireducens TaxID=2758038 RepID=UPI00163B3169|nr:PAS domain S-box protein [Pontibrevibacter nitratireducens]